MTEKELQTNMRSQEWRLSNLYYIKDKNGNRIKFKMNWAQKLLYDNLWYLNIILKVRQLGITTFICLLYLDETIFYGKDAGLIAHTLDDAKKIFASKIRYAWDNMPKAIRESYVLDAESARELKFNREKMQSSIYVGTSLRSGTLQNLHISELSTIDQRYPEKAQEIKSGAFNTVATGQRITVESTAKGQVGLFGELCQVAMDNERRGIKLTELDWKFFFLVWYKHKGYSLNGDIVIPREFQEYFNKLEKEGNIVLTQEQKNWYYKTKQTQGDKMLSEFPSNPDEAFRAVIEGAYYSKEMNRVLDEKRICAVPYEQSIPVDTWWDLGTARNRKDANSIIFTQDIGLEIHIIDFYGNSGEGFAHYIRILKEKGYVYGKHHAPHDIEAVELGTGKSRMEFASQLGLHFDKVPNVGFIDGVDNVRTILRKCWFDEKKTTELVKALRAYRKEWDEKMSRWKDNPHKDWASDPCDAIRYLAVGHRDHIKLGNYDIEEEELRKINEKGDFDKFEPFPQLY